MFLIKKLNISPISLLSQSNKKEGYNCIVDMGKFTKDKRVTKNNQYSNHVHIDFDSNLGYLLS